MTDYEKVMHGLLHHIAPTPCDGCPYDDEDPHCSQRLVEDALALLKEQEPRVMTLDEISSSCRPFAAYAENWDGELFQVAYIGGKYLDMDGKQCPDRVRLWTSRPTDEQRKAVAWDA